MSFAIILTATLTSILAAMAESPNPVLAALSLRAGGGGTPDGRAQRGRG